MAMVDAAVTGMTALAALAMVAACTSSDAPVDVNAGPLVQVAESTSNKGMYHVVVLAHDSALPRGNYDLEYIFTTTADDSPVDGLAMTIVPWMPAMGHGTPIVPTITAVGGGVYDLSDIDMFMAGLWQLRTTTTGSSDDPSDEIEPSLQVH